MKQEQMTNEQAMNLLTQVCAAYKGNLAEHQLFQQALKLVGAKVFPVPVTEASAPGRPRVVKPDFKKDKTETVAE